VYIYFIDVYIYIYIYYDVNIKFNIIIKMDKIRKKCTSKKEVDKLLKKNLENYKKDVKKIQKGKCDKNVNLEKHKRERMYIKKYGKYIN
jgi:hypothetical protein